MFRKNTGKTAGPKNQNKIIDAMRLIDFAFYYLPNLMA